MSEIAFRTGQYRRRKAGAGRRRAKAFTSEQIAPRAREKAALVMRAAFPAQRSGFGIRP
ncbi:hypothetical protein [Novosphingobium sp. SCN 63-17]|uniref:hypothetical protein n=1 Tax=Novosphingobium sp. SCN 63-17 TaxID=1660120 RepID=UPI0025E0CDED|nr:hypothetical protein [Novosphingobium sp. SCN 63-17]